MAIDFNSLFAQLKTEIINLAKENFHDLIGEAASDGTTLLHTIDDDLRKYTQELKDGDIDEDGFKLLLLGDKDLVEMSALTQAGLAQAKADAFKTELFNAITNTVLAAI
jgi:hypothetical protein